MYTNRHSHQHKITQQFLIYLVHNYNRYTYEAIGKLFVDNLGKRLHVNFLGYAHWSMSIIIYQMKDHSISVDQSRYATSIVAKYLDNDTVKASTEF